MKQPTDAELRDAMRVLWAGIIARADENMVHVLFDALVDALKLDMDAD